MPLRSKTLPPAVRSELRSADRLDYTRSVRVVSSKIASFAVATIVAAAGAANAFMHVPFVGRFTTNRGALINSPLAGNAACPSLTIMSGPGGTMVPAEQTPPARTMTVPAAPFGCVAGNGQITTTGMGAGVGGGFVIAPGALRDHSRAIPWRSPTASRSYSSRPASRSRVRRRPSPGRQRER